MKTKQLTPIGLKRRAKDKGWSVKDIAKLHPFYKKQYPKIKDWINFMTQ